MAENPLMELWNKTHGFPKIVGLNGRRKDMANARWKEAPDITYWQNIINLISSSPFCKGDNERGWVANFDWLIRPGTDHKILEGKYHKNQISQKLELARVISLIANYNTREPLPKDVVVSERERQFLEANGGRYRLSQLDNYSLARLVSDWR